jgi:hypothetical protein
LRCENCWQLYADNGGAIMPMCRTAAGCPIKDLATDAAINRFIERYRIARALYDVNGISEMLLREFKELGLEQDSLFLLKLEQIYRVYINNAKRDRKH